MPTVQQTKVLLQQQLISLRKEYDQLISQFSSNYYSPSWEQLRQAIEYNLNQQAIILRYMNNNP